MPFGVSWTDAPLEQIGTNSLRFFWRQRAELSAERWTVNCVVRADGTAIGMQSMNAKDFAVTRTIGSGSWLGMRFHGQGYGTEMRAAMLMFAFDHLGAQRAESAAFEDNAASLRVSEKLGYEPNGVAVVPRRTEPATEVRMLLTAERFERFRPEWKLGVEGAQRVREFLTRA